MRSQRRQARAVGKRVEKRQDAGHGARCRAVARIGGERRRPDEAVAEPRQALDGVDHRLRVAALQPVRKDDGDGAAHQRGMPRHRQEFLQRGADQRAAVEVEDRCRTAAPAPSSASRCLSVLVTRDSRVPKQKVSTLGRRRGDEMREAQIDLGLRLHRAGHVDQEQQAARLLRPRLRASAAASRRRCGAQRARCAARSIRAPRDGRIQLRLRTLGMPVQPPLQPGQRVAVVAAKPVKTLAVAQMVVGRRRCPPPRPRPSAAGALAAWLVALRGACSSSGSSTLPSNVASPNQASNTASKIGKSSGEPVSVTRPSRARSSMSRRRQVAVARRKVSVRPGSTASPASRSAAGKPASRSVGDADRAARRS